MELYTDGIDRTVTLDVPVTPIPGTLNVTIYDAEAPVHVVSTVTAQTGGLSFIMPFSLVQNETQLMVDWSFNYVEDATTITYSNQTYVDVVTPILPLQVITDIIGDGTTPEEAVSIEQSVRNIIQSCTGQTFGKHTGQKTINSTGGGLLRLPSRLISLTSLNSITTWNTFIDIDNSRWALRARQLRSIPATKTNFYGMDGYVTSDIPIDWPNRGSYKFVENAQYTLDGTWGWNFVPAAIQEAAALLVHDYSCMDATYRDRYLISMTAADWRIQFYEGAFANTGNARADKLLEPYIRPRRWVVI
jgi:hypothetical protein